VLVTTEAKTDAISVSSYRCDAGPEARPFTELHEGYSVSYVRKGSFGYRTRGHAYELVTGSVLGSGAPGTSTSARTTTTCAATSASRFICPPVSST